MCLLPLAVSIICLLLNSFNQECEFHNRIPNGFIHIYGGRSLLFTARSLARPDRLLAGSVPPSPRPPSAVATPGVSAWEGDRSRRTRSRANCVPIGSPRP